MLGSKADFYGNYPPGAANDPNAPYNQEDNPTKEVDVYYSQILSKDVHLNEAEYDPYDEEFINLVDSYNKECASPIELINKLKTILETGKLPIHKDYWLKQCEGWVETDTETDIS